MRMADELHQRDAPRRRRHRSGCGAGRCPARGRIRAPPRPSPGPRGPARATCRSGCRRRVSSRVQSTCSMPSSRATGSTWNGAADVAIAITCPWRRCSASSARISGKIRSRSSDSNSRSPSASRSARRTAAPLVHAAGDQLAAVDLAEGRLGERHGRAREARPRRTRGVARDPSGMPGSSSPR